MKKTISLVLVLALGLAAEVANADFVFGTPTNLGPPVNSALSEMAPDTSADGLQLYFYNWPTPRPGGYGSTDIWVATRATKDDPWGEPVNPGPPVNSSSLDFNTCISADGLSLYFCSDRPGGYGSWDLWVATRATTDDDWGTAVNLGPPVNSSYRERGPSISADGLSLFFHSNRSGGSGGPDILVTTRETTDDHWSVPVNLGPIVNSSERDYNADISADGLLLFFQSNRPGGYGGNDLWATTRDTIDGEWGTPVNLGPTVNSSASDITPAISADGSTLYFSSDRPGGLGGHDIWQVPILNAARAPDLNGDARVDLADFCKLARYWQKNERSVDIAPRPLADGIVDIQDMAVLAEYWLKDSRMIAHWKLDETDGTIAHDTVGGNDGMLAGPVWQPTGGKVDGALEFDGQYDLVSTDFVLDPAEGAFSVFAWIKGGAPGQVIISQADGTGQGSAWLCAEPSDGKLTTTLMNPPFSSLESESIITDDQWHHIGLMYDIDALRRHLYVDGAEVAKDATIAVGVPSDGGLYFGVGKDFLATSCFSGLIDDVRIYNQALSAAEIEKLAR